MDDTMNNAEYMEEDDVYVTFSINEKKMPLFALPKKEVMNIIHLESGIPYTNIPNSPEHVAGIIYHEGDMITIINPYDIWGLPSDKDELNKLICIRNHGEIIGICAEEVENVQVPEEQIKGCGVVKARAFAHNGRIYTMFDLSQFGIDLGAH